MNGLEIIGLLTAALVIFAGAVKIIFISAEIGEIEHDCQGNAKDLLL
jgi:hypothetical protein